MLKPLAVSCWGNLGVNADEIRQMRGLLAAQPAASETRTPGLHHKLKTFLARKSSIPADGPFAMPSATDRSDLLELDAIAADPTPGDPIPPELLLGGLAPRRPAFGQRVERVLELEAPMPAEPRRLILCASGGEAVGEIFLHAGAAGLHAQEAPFFPEDLADEPLPRPKPRLETAPPSEAAPAPEPALELAATFLLANLAARLASEEAAFKRRLRVTRALYDAA